MFTNSLYLWIFIKTLCFYTTFLVILMILMSICVTIKTNNQTQLSTWFCLGSLKQYFHSHLPFMRVTVSDRNYSFIPSVILSLHLLVTINRGVYFFSSLFFKRRHWMIYSWTFYYWVYIFVCILVLFPLLLSPTKQYSSFCLNKIYKSIVKITCLLIFSRN